ncbi:envelope stress response membrane protein PspB [Lichenicoccus roseus]|uniref:Envelope stress response membrane protein PspB n=1 Tax=Lichenicoccus roseus TaxID=2683649 RepID=A0A5R9J8B6_9PROT|nr:envelope stress response membrane protein PspB [Lichenicoccus roseus]TLU71861.1 envelope stress response membrane protein PspB [Lichenicoccus roseus]
MIENLTGLIAVIAPFALVFFIIRMKHERRMREMNLQGLSQEEQRVLADMGETARRMEQRIENLERILDSELAGWRSRMSL